MAEPFIFFRKEGWYIVETVRNQIVKNVELNPGTIKVEDANGNLMWQDHDKNELRLVERVTDELNKRRTQSIRQTSKE